MGNCERTNWICGEIVDSAMRVHSTLGPGLLEGAYEACLAHELSSRDISVAAQVPLPLTYKGARVDVGYRLDLLVEEAVVVELKATSKLLPIHEAQLLSYLRLSGHRVGLLINFHEVHLKHGIKRMLNGY
ncbi:MAG: GxxExxY protein [Gemmatimonadetes bacterium]|nr:GxxExxY protein [Gemmatimonadota bacterium]